MNRLVLALVDIHAIETAFSAIGAGGSYTRGVLHDIIVVFEIASDPRESSGLYSYREGVTSAYLRIRHAPQAENWRRFDFGLRENKVDGGIGDEREVSERDFEE